MPRLSRSEDEQPPRKRRSRKKAEPPTPGVGRTKVHRRDAEEVRLVTRREAVADMRAKRITWGVIADTLGVSTAQARRDWHAVLDDLNHNALREVSRARAEIALQRSAVISAHLPVALDPDNENAAASAAIVDKNQAGIARLYGLDAPQMHQHLVETFGEEEAKPKAGLIIEVDGQQVDWREAREQAERNRSAIHYQPPEDDEGEVIDGNGT